MKSIILNFAVTAGLIVSGGTWATDMPDLAKTNSCVACHAMDKKLIGPSFIDIAKKYKGAKTYTFKQKEYPLVEGLMMKVSQGGSGNWGSMAMPPIDPTDKKQDQVKKLVEFILGLSN